MTTTDDDRALAADTRTLVTALRPQVDSGTIATLLQRTHITNNQSSVAALLLRGGTPDTITALENLADAYARLQSLVAGTDPHPPDPTGNMFDFRQRGNIWAGH